MRVTRTLFFLVGALALSEAPIAAQYSAPAAIVATLPPFCGGQYIDGLDSDPRYTISGCGPAGNHYCPGLVQIAKSKKAKTKGEKLEFLRMAESEMIYTLKFTANFPDCMLRPLAEEKKKEISRLRQLVK